MLMGTERAIRVLLMEGERPKKILLERAVPEKGKTVVALRSGDEAIELLAKQRFDVSRLDFELAGVGRIETRSSMHPEGGSALVVVNSHEARSAYVGEISDEEELEFLTLPLKTDDLTEIVREARRRLAEGPIAIPEDGQGSDPNAPYFGRSRAMRELLEIIPRVAAGTASVLIHGETGSGKSVIARQLHAASPRAEQPLVAINCGAFQDHLLESELFGHEKGSFTGAIAAKQGLFEVADGGTLFLDEIAEMSTAMQAKLLQVLDEGEMRRVGGIGSRRVNVRILAATNKDLKQEVKAGNFRQDLYFRLNVIQLCVPPLRERQEDIPGLVERFLERFQVPTQPRKSVSPEALEMLKFYSWPGNVRELANSIEGLILLAPTAVIRAEDLPPGIRPAVPLDLGDSTKPVPLAEVERLQIIRTLRYTKGKKAAAARSLGIDIKTLNSKIRNYNVEL
jgi:DNA-binding NtrC family response regulator